MFGLAVIHSFMVYYEEYDSSNMAKNGIDLLIPGLTLWCYVWFLMQ